MLYGIHAATRCIHLVHSMVHQYTIVLLIDIGHGLGSDLTRDQS